MHMLAAHLSVMPTTGCGYARTDLGVSRPQQRLCEKACIAEGGARLRVHIEGAEAFRIICMPHVAQLHHLHVQVCCL